MTPGTVVTRSVTQRTTTIPIVSVSGDPIGSGFAKSLAQPGGNVTGLTVTVGPELAEKWLELMVEIVPGARRLAMLRNALNSSSAAQRLRLRAAADRLGSGVAIEEYAIRETGDLAPALETIRQGKIDALIVDNDPLLVAKAAEIASLAAPVPTISGSRDFVAAGGLISYGASIFDILRRSGSYIDRILKGAKPARPADEQPIKFELVVNLKTAKTIGLTIPQSIFARADEVIE